MDPNTPIKATIDRRFDLGYILTLPNGSSGQLRVPEMTRQTLDFDASSDRNAGVGTEVTVYIIAESGFDYLLSEYSPIDRRRREDSIAKFNVGDQLTVVVKHKTSWGCICSDPANLVFGIILAPKFSEEYESELVGLDILDSAWNSIATNSKIDVEIIRINERNKYSLSCDLRYLQHAEEES